MAQLPIALTPEAYKLWVFRPEILYVASPLIVDLHDFNEVLARRDESLMQSRMAALLEAFRDEKLIRCEHYAKSLPPELRDGIHQRAGRLVSSLSERELADLALHAYTEYEAYLRARTTFLSAADANVRRGSTHALLATRRHLDSLRRGAFGVDKELTEHVVWILERIFAKWMAGEAMAHVLGATSVHDTDEYRPFADIILKRGLVPEGVECIYPSDQDPLLPMLNEVLGFVFDTPQLQDPEDLAYLIPKREAFGCVRDVFADLRSLRDEYEDLMDFRNAVRNRVRFAKQEVEAELKKWTHEAPAVVPAILDFVLGLFGKPSGAGSLTKKLRDIEHRRVARKIAEGSGSAFVRLSCFAVYAKRKLPPIPAWIKREAGGSDQESWITSHVLPWYEGTAQARGA